MTNYQVISPDYFEEQVALGGYAFNMEITEDRRNRFKETFEHTISLGAFHEEKLSAQVLVTPYVVHFHQALYKMGGIGLVSSYPEYRGSGDVAALMKLSLKTMNEKGMDLSYLAPFSYPFYRKYGFEQIFDQFKMTLTAEQLPRVKTKSGKLERVIWEQGKESMKFLYEQQKANSVGAVQREDWWWEYRFTHKPDQKIALYTNEANQPEGYIVYYLDGETFKIEEMIYHTHTAYEMLWGFISSHSGSFKFFDYTGGMDEQQAYLLENPRIKQEVIPSMMGRIVNIQRFLSQYPFKELSEKELYLEISDPIAPWNDGIWQLTFTKGQPQFTAVTQVNTEKEQFLIKGDIQTWTQAFIGYRSISELHFFHRLTGNQSGIAELERIIPKGIPTLSDYF
ncbi:GNAT family N-acetyltransferase [Carnobacterium gallinarum]|uniref:GNAT family N-acetyltransferase n=1 Tax=Carnobacterium gallinarum TaxID=2749 RepID=UPI000553A5E7|nr:GNAT family N-acetyltransferase [Carnobacterium gallinarum]